MADASERARFAALADPCALLRRQDLDTQFAVTGSKFVAFAIANLDNDPDLEVWSIDDTKLIRRWRSDSDP